jgi:hypothetical protein
MIDALFADWIEITLEETSGGSIAHVRLGVDGPVHDGEDHVIAHFVVPGQVINLLAQEWGNISRDPWSVVKTTKDGGYTRQKVVRLNANGRQRPQPV